MVPRMPAPALALTFLLLAPPPAQDPGVVAWYELGGERRAIAKAELAMELAQRLRRKERGKQALQQLVDLALVRAAATREGLMPSPQEVRDWVEQLAGRLRKVGEDLDKQIRAQGMTSAEFSEYAALSMAHERLVRRELGLAAGQPVDQAALQLWLQEARTKQPVETDEAKLPPGIVALVAGRELALLDLGQLLLRSATRQERHQFVQQIVWRTLVQREAKRLGLEVTDEEAEREVEVRRKQFEASGRLRGVAFDALLQAEGTTPQELARSPVLRAHILEQKIVRQLLPEERMQQRLREEPEAVQGQYGARRRIAWIFVEAPVPEGAAKPTPEQREQAEAEAARLRERITGGDAFDKVAREISDDVESRIAGGDVGWQFRLGEGRIPPAVRAAAFELRRDEVSRPIAVPGGAALVTVTGIEAEPHPEVLKQRMRDSEVERLRRQWLTDAKLELVQG